jgi:hypothetical protein
MWLDLVAWFQSPGGARVLQTAIIPALAILVAGLLAAAIARSAVSATIRRAERMEAASVVAGLVAAARLAADAGDDGASRRRAARLRIEADVRMRLLPLPGAELAADWAADRTDALQRQAASGPVTADFAELRDRLVQWVGKPARARRLFAAPSAQRVATRAPAPDASDGDAPVAQQPAPEPDRSARSAGGPEPRSTPPEAEGGPAATPAELDREPAGAVPATALGEDVPAWQRTRAVERLQQERSRGRAVESAGGGEDDVAVPRTTAPVGLQRSHRVGATNEPADADEAVRLEAHQQARHARPSEQPPTGAIPATTSAPAWLDTYDDEAQVTQNLDLKTPPPVSASAVRDRGAPGEDLVPRS